MRCRDQSLTYVRVHSTESSETDWSVAQEQSPCSRAKVISSARGTGTTVCLCARKVGLRPTECASGSKKGTDFTVFTRIRSERILDLNVKHETIHLLEGKTQMTWATVVTS